MESCDDAFLYSICKRSDYAELFMKINNYADFFVAFTHEILGYAAIYANDHINHMAYITLIGVRKEFQNSHIGKNLLQACRTVCKYRDLNSIKLQVRKNNLSAIRFYRNNGFEIISQADDDTYFMLCYLGQKEDKNEVL